MRNDNKNNSDFEIFKRLWGETKNYRGTFLISIILYLPVTLFMIAEPLVIGGAVQYGFVPKNLDKVLLWSSIYFGVVVAQSTLQMTQLYLMSTAGQGLVKNLRQKIFNKIQTLPMSYFDKTPMGKLLTRVTNDNESLTEVFTSGSVAVIGDSLFLVATLVMLITVDINLSAGVFIMLPFLVVGLVVFKVLTKKAFEWVRSILASLNAFLQEQLSGMQTVQIFAQVEGSNKKFDHNNQDYMHANKRAVFLDAAVYSFVDFMSIMCMALVLYFGFNLQQQGVLKLGVLVAFIEAITRFFFPVREIANRLAIFQSSFVAGHRIFDLLDIKSEDLDNLDNLNNKKNNIRFEKSLDFKNIDFGYDKKNLNNKNNLVLKNIFFELYKNKQVALVGPTGAGKSSMIKIATKFYEINSGEILLDGQNINNFELSHYRKIFNLVPQEPFLFSGTLRENLSYGLPENRILDSELNKALERCQIDYILERSSGEDGEDSGLDQKIEPRGKNFSVGERQLIAFARALLAQSEILILDEATASIDVMTEKKLQKATQELLKNKTAMIIAHRLSTIKHCDEILVFDKGQIIERGKHAELMQQNGLYAKMVCLQEKEAELAVLQA